MAIRVIVEFQARPGARAELASVLEYIMATLGPGNPGFLGSTIYEVLDNPDARLEIAEWDSADAQSAVVRHAMESGVYDPVFELVDAPLKAIRIGQLDERVRRALVPPAPNVWVRPWTTRRRNRRSACRRLRRRRNQC